MRLLKRLPNGDLELVSFDDEEPPPYAILSHTWGEGSEEVTFEDMANGAGRHKTGFKKIKFCGEQAARDGLHYFWVDSCCINEKIRAELQEAVLSMFRWYQRSTKCYVYLFDVLAENERATWKQAFRQSRWFTRGWTLQELLAPMSVEFFSAEGSRLGDKHSLEQSIHEITGIPRSALQGDHLSRFSVEDRMQWIQPRQTKREEDLAYSLLGIFGVNLSLRYDEGKVAAFERLQKEIEKFQECCRDLRLINPADHKKDIEHRKGGLLANSYQWILQHSDFQTWCNNEQSHLLWIKGDPGKGKTMLLCGIINELPKLIEKRALLSYFFCVATDSRINNATAVLRGLMYMLVCQQPSLVSHIRKKYDYAGKGLFDDSNAWFALSNVFTDMLQDRDLNSTYLVVDALDECTAEDLPKLLDFIVTKTSLSSRVRWIVSSRNWPSIEKDLDAARRKVRLCLELNENSISAAVTTYIQSKVDWLAKRNRYSSDTKRAVHHYLSRNAGGTFLWVALVCQELSKVPGWKAQQKLTAFPPGLDALYRRMMGQIMNSEDAGLCTSILAVASAVYRPVTLDELAAFIDIPDGVCGDDEVLSDIVGLCGSFLTLRERNISFVHQSAKDFLVKKTDREIYPSGIENIHYTIFLRSLHIMSNRLRRDVYGLDAPGTSIDHVEQPSSDPLSQAKYSCVYWVDHLLGCNPTGNATNDLQDGGSINKFLRQHFLHWLEALSWMRRISDGINAIISLQSAVKNHDCRRLFEFIHDMRRFVLYNRSAIEQAPLQTYCSALVFTPTNSVVKAQFGNLVPQWMRKLPLVRKDWTALLQTLEGHQGPVNAVVFSQDGELLASCSEDSTVKVWDAGTGALRQSLESHSGSVREVEFSLDGTMLASVSEDRIIRVHDVSTGEVRQTLEGHSDTIRNLKFSRDSALLVSSSDDGAVKMWNINTGAHCQVIEDSLDPILAVTFSPDGVMLALESNDYTIRLWDTSTDAVHQTLEGHSESVDVARFSPDGTMLASGSDDGTVKLWDIDRSTPRQTLEDPLNTILAVAFSPDGMTLALASNDQTIRLWDTNTGAVHQTLEGHTNPVSAVSFSPDGAMLASGSEGFTVRLWDIETDLVQQTLERHQGWVEAVIFSPDGTMLASSSSDGTVKLWDVDTEAYYMY